MELCIKTVCVRDKKLVKDSFNPCFNGTMYKNGFLRIYYCVETEVSILVLMELCIKTIDEFDKENNQQNVSILVLMELCIKTRT